MPVGGAVVLIRSRGWSSHVRGPARAERWKCEGAVGRDKC